MTEGDNRQPHSADVPAQEVMQTKTHGRWSVIVGWVLLVLSAMVAINIVVQPHTRDSSIEALMSHLDSPALAGTIGFLIGIHALQLVAMLLGVYAVLRKNPGGRPLLIVNTFLQFLPSSGASSNSHQNSSVSNTEADPRRVASDIARELKNISKDDVVKDFVETLDETLCIGTRWVLCHVSITSHIN